MLNFCPELVPGGTYRELIFLHPTPGLSTLKETELYAPIKSFLENQGYHVKAEVASCDVVAQRGSEPVVIIELKVSFNLPLVFQAIARQSMSDHVYVAFPRPVKTTKSFIWNKNRRDILKLCRMLGIGLISVKFYQSRAPFVEVHQDPLPYRPRKNKRAQSMLLKEFQLRVGDHNQGGSHKRPIVTAYRQEVLLCAHQIHKSGPSSLARLREETGLAEVGRIFQSDVYGWFNRTCRATYDLSPRGRQALIDYKDVISDLINEDSQS